MRNQRLIEAREQRGWTQEKAAEKIGVSRVSYARWEEQGIIPRLWAMNQASEVFKMSAEQLGFRKYSPNPSTSRHLLQPVSTHGAETNHADTGAALINIGLSALTHICFHLKQPIQQLQLHQKALQFRSDVSPLLQSWLYIVLAESQANPVISQQEAAKQSLSVARDLFPEHPEDDPHFAYVPIDHFFFVNHEVLTQLHLNQPKQALERLDQVDKSVPTTVVPRRVELLNRRATTSLKLGDMDQACTCVEMAGTSALQLGSHLRYSEACETYQHMHLKWPHERKVKGLAELFRQD